MARTAEQTNRIYKRFPDGNLCNARRTPERIIRIYKRFPDGNLFDARDEFDVADLCGAIPRVGEYIVSPYLRDSKEDGRLWSNRTIYVVEAVYYRPDVRNPDNDNSWIVLVVHERPMTKEEAELV